MFDLVIRHGNVLTGEGSPALPDHDVAVVDGRIAEVGRRLGGQARREIYADGLCVCPGFIDMHGHSDLEALCTPGSEYKILQGITTEVTGNCGFSLFPTTPPHGREAFDYLAQLFEGLSPEHPVPSLAEYARRLTPTSTNLVPLVGHNMLRIAANGLESTLAPGGLERMRQLLDAELRTGAAGMSTGLLYTPACFADSAELTALAQVLSAHGRPMTCHLRDEGDHLEASLAEMFAVVKATRVSLQVSHLKVSGRRNWGKMADALRQLAALSAAGFDVNFDSYPYVFGCTTIVVLIPTDLIAGDLDAFLARLRDPAFRQTVRERMRGGAGLLHAVGAENIVVAGCGQPPYRTHLGKSLAQMAEALKRDTVDLVCDLVIAERGRTNIFLFQMDEKEVRLALAHPLGILGSDGIPVRQGIAHPRLSSAYLHLLSHYVADERLMALEEAVRKMTALPARKLGLRDRGRLQPGKVADIVVFAPDRVRGVARPNSGESRRGVDYAIVNGHVAVESAEYTGTRAGRLLLRPARPQT